MADSYSTEGCSLQCDKLTYIASILVAVVFLANAGLILANRGTQDAIVQQQVDLSNRSAKLQANGAFENVSRNLVQALANSAIERKDDQIKSLLIQNGVSLTPPKK